MRGHITEWMFYCKQKNEFYPADYYSIVRCLKVLTSKYDEDGDD
jgi:hypothetical protein